MLLTKGCKCKTGCTTGRCGCKRKQQVCSEGCTCTHCLNLPHSCDHATMTDDIEIEDDMRDIFGPLCDYDTDSETESESNSDEFD